MKRQALIKSKIKTLFRGLFCLVLAILPLAIAYIMKAVASVNGKPYETVDTVLAETDAHGFYVTTYMLSLVLALLVGLGLIVVLVLKIVRNKDVAWRTFLIFCLALLVVEVVELAGAVIAFVPALGVGAGERGHEAIRYINDNRLWTYLMVSLLVAIASANLYLLINCTKRNKSSWGQRVKVVMVLFVALLPVLIGTLTHVISFSKGVPHRGCGCIPGETRIINSELIKFFTNTEKIGSVVCLLAAFGLLVWVVSRFFILLKKHDNLSMAYLYAGLLLIGYLVFAIIWFSIMFGNFDVESYSNELGGTIQYPLHFKVGYEQMFFLFLVLPLASAVSLVYNAVWLKKSVNSRDKS